MGVCNSSIFQYLTRAAYDRGHTSNVLAALCLTDGAHQLLQVRNYPIIVSHPCCTINARCTPTVGYGIVHFLAEIRLSGGAQLTNYPTSSVVSRLCCSLSTIVSHLCCPLSTIVSRLCCTLLFLRHFVGHGISHLVSPFFFLISVWMKHDVKRQPHVSQASIITSQKNEVLLCSLTIVVLIVACVVQIDQQTYRPIDQQTKRPIDQ